MPTTRLDAALDVMEKKIRERMESETGYGDKQAMYLKLGKKFKKFDTDGSKKLNRPEFTAALVTLNFVGCQQNIDALFDRYDEDDSGTISYEEFGKQILGLKPNPVGAPESRSVLERVRAKIAQRGGLNGIRTLGILFRIIDDNRSKSLSYEEFKKGMNDFGVPLTEKEFMTLCKVFDRDGNRSITFDEFLRGIRGKMSSGRRKMVRLAFNIVDSDKTGIIELKELASRYDTSKHPEVKAGKKTHSEVMKDFMGMWDSETAPDGKVTFPEFLDYYRDISASIDSDEYFELMIRNAWHISGGKGASQNTSNIRVCVTHTDGSQEIVGLKDDLGVSRSSSGEIILKLLRSQGVKDIEKFSLSSA